MSADRVKLIERRLSEAFDPESMLVKDQSHLHAGHAGAEGGMGHFEVQIVAAAFEGLSRIQRHRKVYEAMGSLMETDIHALSVKAFAPNER
jgi:BolA protein